MRSGCPKIGVKDRTGPDFKTLLAITGFVLQNPAAPNGVCPRRERDKVIDFHIMKKTHFFLHGGMPLACVRMAHGLIVSCWGNAHVIARGARVPVSVTANGKVCVLRDDQVHDRVQERKGSVSVHKLFGLCRVRRGWQSGQRGEWGRSRRRGRRLLRDRSKGCRESSPSQANPGTHQTLLKGLASCSEGAGVGRSGEENGGQTRE